MRSVLLLLPVLACNGGNPSQAPAKSMAASSASPPVADSVAAIQAVQKTGLTSAKIVASTDGYFAVVGSRGTSGFHLALLHEHGGVVQQLREDSLREFQPRGSQWLRAGGDAVDGFFYSLDYPSEAVVGSVAYGLRGDSLITTFADTSGACQASVVRPAPGGKGVDLIVYVEPYEKNCTSECTIAILEHKSPSAWTSVLHWRNGVWQNVEHERPAYYEAVAKQYQAIAQWASSGRAASACEDTAGLLRQYFTWAQRAHQLSLAR
jgi:hypothetical protein